MDAIKKLLIKNDLFLYHLLQYVSIRDDLTYNSILYTKVKKFMIIARAPRLEPEARRGL
jgi:hypothetical protein